MQFSSLIMVLALTVCIFSCTNNKKSAQSFTSPYQKTTKPGDSLSIPKHLYAKNDNICIVVGKRTYCIQKDEDMDYKNSYQGIYEINKNSVIKSYNLVLSKFVYFTTYDDVGMGLRGHLYVFDTVKKALIKDLEFKRNYLYSSGGIFIIDRSKNKIFSVESSWYDKKQTSIISASMYSISENHFKFFKNIYDQGEDLQNDTLITTFYHNSLANNGKYGKVLPKDWWK